MKITLVLLMAAAVLGAGGSALAGPNAGGVLILHDAGPAFSDYENWCGLGAVPLTCAEVDTRVDDTAQNIWKIYAAFPPGSQPRLNGVSFQCVYSEWEIVVLSFDWCWGFAGFAGEQFCNMAAPNTVCARVWDNTRVDLFTELAWVAGYAYSYSPCTFALGPGDCGDSPGYFVDDTASLDEIADYGRLGFFTDGYLPCPAANAVPDPGLDPAGDNVHGLEAAPVPARSGMEMEITWRQDSGGSVVVQILDAGGRLVRGYDLGLRPEGSHRVRWDGRDDIGRPAPAGVYFVRLRAGTQVSATKVAVLP